MLAGVLKEAMLPDGVCNLVFGFGNRYQLHLLLFVITTLTLGVICKYSVLLRCKLVILSFLVRIQEKNVYISLKAFTTKIQNPSHLHKDVDVS